MQLDTAAKIGLGLLKHHKEIGAVLGGAGKLLGGEGFAKIAETLNLSGKIAGSIDKELKATPAAGLNTLQAIKHLHYFDADGNGQISKEELTAGLKKLQESGLASKPAFSGLQKFGQNLLKQYDQVAALDGKNAGISYVDVGMLAGKDNQYTHIADADWAKLTPTA